MKSSPVYSTLKMIELEIILLVLCVVNLGLLAFVIFRKPSSNNKEIIQTELKEISNELTLKMVSQQGELKEHLAKQIGENNTHMLTLYI